MAVRKITRERLERFLRKYANDAYTLDLGCANSPYSKLFPNRFGVDVKEGKGVDVVADAHELPLPDEKFEQIVATEVLEHLHTPEVAIKEMTRVLKPGGRLILTTRFIFPLHDTPHDYYRYTKYGLQHLFRDWEIVTLEEEVDSVETLSVLLQRLMFQGTHRGGKAGKVIIYACSKLILALEYILKREYGDTERTTPEKQIMTSGYYLVAKKK